MAHYAFLDENNTVVEVIAGKDEFEDGVDWEQRYSEIRNQRCKRTSYNTRGGVHLTGGVPYRKNYAGIGYVYSEDLDAFVPPQPYPSWVLNESSCLWEPPVPYPDSSEPLLWSESDQNWITPSIELPIPE